MQNATRRVTALALALSVSASLSQASVDPSQGRVTAHPTKSWMQSVQERNPDLRAAGNILGVIVNGQKAKSLELPRTSAVADNGGPMPERLLLLPLPGKGKLILYMVFFAPDADFDALRPAFDRVRNSFTAR